jgi:hypothetical protein
MIYTASIKKVGCERQELPVPVCVPCYSTTLKFTAFCKLTIRVLPFTKRAPRKEYRRQKGRRKVIKEKKNGNVEQIAFPEILNLRIRRFFRGLPQSILEIADMVP